MSKEAMKLALEALENAQANVGEWWPEAITAIREALASEAIEQPAQYLSGLAVYLDPTDGLKPKRHSPQPAQQQEPVATKWLAEMIMSDCGFSTEYTPLLDRIVKRIEAYDRANSPPAQRQSRSDVKPLTDKEIDSFREANSEGRGAGWRFNFKGFARAIEAAHGIYAPTELKEKNT